MPESTFTAPVLLSAQQLTRKSGLRDRLADEALRGVLGLYVQIHCSTGRCETVTPWDSAAHSESIPGERARVDTAARFEGDERFEIDGWFRASRSMVDELFTSESGNARLSVEIWDEPSGSWRVLQIGEHRSLANVWLLHEELLHAGLVEPASRSSDDSSTDPRAQHSILIILGALAEMAGVDQRGSSGSVCKHLSDFHEITKPGEATVRKYLTEAVAFLREHSPKKSQ